MTSSKLTAARRVYTVNTSRIFTVNHARKAAAAQRRGAAGKGHHTATKDDCAEIADYLARYPYPLRWI